MQANDRVEHGLERPAQRAIVAVIKTLKIDLVGLNPGSQMIERLGGRVAVGDKGAEKSRGSGMSKDLDRPFRGDERLVVARHDELRLLPNRHADELLGADRLGRRG